MSEVWVSPLAGVAFVAEGEACSIVDLEEGAVESTARRGFLRHLERTYPDLEYQQGNLRPQDVFAAFSEGKKRQRGLFLLLTLLDRRLTGDSRSEASKDLESLLDDQSVSTHLRNVMFSSPLPDEADPEGAIVIGEACGMQKCSRFVSDILRMQSLVIAVNRAWMEAASIHFDDVNSAKEIRIVLVNRGVFSTLLEGLSRGPGFDPGAWVVSQANRSAVRSVPRITQLLNAIARSVWNVLSAPESSLSPWLAEIAESPASRERRDAGLAGKRIRLDRVRIKEQVDRQIQAIGRLIESRDLYRARRYVNDLIGIQSGRGETDYLVKSLCNIASTARRCGEWDFAYDLLTFAVELDPSDAWAWQQLAVVLLELSDLPQALAAARKAVQYRNDTASRNLLAEIYKAQGEYEAASETYRAVLQEFPDNRHALNGLAGVFKARDDYGAALQAYDSTLRNFPEDQYALAGRGEVLKAQGRYDEALEAYDSVLEMYPTVESARNGRAEVLMEAGRYDEALLAYEAVLQDRPRSVYARNGRAEVLRAMGQYEASLVAYDENVEMFPRDVYALSGRAEVLKALGQYGEALSAYDEILEMHPLHVAARNGRAEVLKAQGRFGEAFASYDETLLMSPRNRYALNGRCEVLRVQGRYTEALTSYQETLGLFPRDRYALVGRAEVLRAHGEYVGALAAYDEVQRLFPNDAFIRNRRTILLLLMRRLQEARDRLLTTAPKSREGWLGLHVRGMLHLREAELHKAIETFKDGMMRCPYSDEIPIFATSLGVTYIQARRFEDAVRVLEPLNGRLSAGMGATKDLVLVHSYGELGNLPKAAEIVEGTSRIEMFSVVELRGFLIDKYGLGGRGTLREDRADLTQDIEEAEFKLLSEGPLAVPKDLSEVIRPMYPVSELIHEEA